MADQPVRVAVICTGNICRSPMAEVLLTQMVAQDPTLRGRVTITSAGTAKWHVGSEMDERARGALDRAGFNEPGTPAAYADRNYLNAQDIVVAMTREHVHDVNQRLTNDETDVILLRNLLQPGQHLDVADPYYGDADEFDDCLELLRQGGLCLTSVLRSRLGAGSSEV